MDRFSFFAAKAVFFPYESAECDRAEHSVTHYGFHHTFYAGDTDAMTICIAAKNAYRLYIDGRIVMHGPARTAHGYARVDEIPVSGIAAGEIHHIAAEVVVYGSTYNGYSNECTLEPGLLTLEVRSGGKTLAATGQGDWQVCRLTARLNRTERISHSRTCSEICDLRGDLHAWKFGQDDGFVPAQLCGDPVYLKRHSPLPTLDEHAARDLIGFGACRIDRELPLQPSFWNREMYTPKGYYETLSEHAFDECRQTVEDDALCAVQGAVTAQRLAQDALLLYGAPDKYAAYDLGENHVGFPYIELTAETEGIVDILHCEALEPDGSFAFPHNIVTRLYVPAGRTAFVSMEAGIARYIKLYLRGTGHVTVHRVGLMDYTFPDAHKSAFLCSDETINRLYQAAKKTLLLNTLDIFMDCPDRERGGWLCDSLWTARAAMMMLSDAGVEHDFIENFLLIPKGRMFRDFFPEVYPGNANGYGKGLGISTWSFWLMCELYEYVSRTGDRALALEHADRVEAFVDGCRSFIGSSGLVEDLPGIFIDWSLSNRAENQGRISVPANALAAHMLMLLGELYSRPEWTERGTSMRDTLRSAILASSEAPLHKMLTFPDGLNIAQDGTLLAGGGTTESAMATALWSGLFTREEAPALFRNVRDCMGPAPVFPSDPNIGKSGLFIGLCIRLDMLCRLGAYDTMFADLNAIYQPQLREGPGTLWEHSIIGSSSRCHGFNAHAGVHLMRDVLGLGMPERKHDGIHLTVAPHLCGLRWAKGTMELPEGLLSVSWRYDGDRFALDVHLPDKDSFCVRVILPPEAKALDKQSVSVRLHEENRPA